MKRITMRKTMAALLLTLLMASSASAAFKFGVMDDTQWTTTDPASTNPNAVPVSIINQINQQFIDKKVKFVVQVGDLTENGNDADETVRANAAQPLINAGIGFFPMRGNHETYASPANNWAIPIFQSLYPQTRCVNNTFGATNCSSPASAPLPAPLTLNELDGMSYSFDYSDAGSSARFLVLDNWVTPTKNISLVGYNYGYSITEQQGWISDLLNKATRGPKHAFVFSHQPLMAENHQDSPFQGYTDANPAMQNVFFASLMNNDVKYYISGHDHIHQRSVIASPDGLSKVQEIIGASNSSKFYTPKSVTDVNWKGQKVRETSLSQERYTVGYYIYTVDGPRVTVDYYSDNHGNWASDNCFPNGSTPQSCSVAGDHYTPTFTFVKKETWGYSLNGKEILVPQGGSYVLTDDTTKAVANGETGFLGTTANILSGTNGSTMKDYSNRTLTKNVDTGWAPVAPGLASDIFRLWGMTDLGASSTDTYALSLSYNDAILKNGIYRLSTMDENGNLKNAIADNYNNGTPTFVNGPYNSSYALGTYGIDPVAKTAWAVINHASNFTVAMVNGYDVSPQISATTSGFVYSRATRLYSGKITITNTSANAITSPVAVALNGLTSGVTLSNALGSYNGATFTTITNSGLAAGASITIPLSFTNPSNAKINFTPVTFQE